MSEALWRAINLCCQDDADGHFWAIWLNKMLLWKGFHNFLLNEEGISKIYKNVVYTYMSALAHAHKRTDTLTHTHRVFCVYICMCVCVYIGYGIHSYLLCKHISKKQTRLTSEWNWHWSGLRGPYGLSCHARLNDKVCHAAEASSVG